MLKGNVRSKRVKKMILSPTRTGSSFGTTHGCTDRQLVPFRANSLTCTCNCTIIPISMKILKSFALALLSLILLISLSIFGLAYTVNQVALNSHYMVKTLKDINSRMRCRSNQPGQYHGDISPQLESALVDTLRKTEPVIMAVSASRLTIPTFI